MSVFPQGSWFLWLQYSTVSRGCKDFFVKFHESFHGDKPQRNAQNKAAKSVQNVENMDTSRLFQKIRLTDDILRAIFVTQAV